MEYNVPVPSNAVAGDVVLVLLLGATATAPVGWTALTGSVLGTPWNIWRKSLVAGDLGTMPQFTLTSSALVAAAVIHINGTTGVDIVGTIGTTPNALATSLAAPSLTPTGTTDLLLGFWIIAKAGVNIALPVGFTSVAVAQGRRDTQCINGHIHAAGDWVANHNLCPQDNAAKTGVVAGAPSIAVGSKALISAAATGAQTATWTGGAAGMAVQIAIKGSAPIIAFSAVTTQ